MEGKYRDVPHASCRPPHSLPHSQHPHQTGAFVTNDEPAWIRGAVHSRDWHKYIATWSHHYSIWQSSFTALKILFIPPIYTFAGSLNFFILKHFLPFYITVMIRKKNKYCHLKKPFCEGKCKLKLSVSPWLRNSLGGPVQLPWTKAPKGEPAVCVLSFRGRQGGLRTYNSSNRNQPSPPCLLSCLILSWEQETQSTRASWFWVSAQIRCVLLGQWKLLWSSPQPLPIQGLIAYVN